MSILYFMKSGLSEGGYRETFHGLLTF